MKRKHEAMRDLLDMYVITQGWDENSQLEVLLEFITQVSTVDKFVEFLDAITKAENQNGKTLGDIEYIEE